MTVVWVIGSSGLLGSALHQELHRSGNKLFEPSERFCWGNESELIVQLEAAVKAFAKLVGAKEKWQIYWAAGVGTMSSTEGHLAAETRVLSALLGLIELEPEIIEAKGCFAFSSSAGAIYAGATDDIINENSPVAPTTAYAHEKLKQEGLIRTFALNNCRVTALLARITTLYGPGQASGKQQGLITQVARSILRNRPIQIYVPLDTIRDYITASDAAATMIATLDLMYGTSGAFVKIIASEQPTTIAEIVSIYKRIARRSPRIVTSASKLSNIYTRRVQFRSIYPINNVRISRTVLYIGIAQVMAAERFAFAQARV